MSVRLEVPRVVGHPTIVAVAVCARRPTPQTVVIAVVLGLVHVEWRLHWRHGRRVGECRQGRPCRSWRRRRRCAGGATQHASRGGNAYSNPKCSRCHTQAHHNHRDGLPSPRQPSPPCAHGPHNLDYRGIGFLLPERTEGPLLCGCHVTLCPLCRGYDDAFSTLCTHGRFRVSVRETGIEGGHTNVPGRKLLYLSD